MARRNDDGSKSTKSSLPVSSSSSSSTTKSYSHIALLNYCISTVNYLISTLRLPIPPLLVLEDVSIEVLLRIHCGLLGIDFAKDFIPSAHPRDDADRMILSLKDRFGTDKFGALDGQKIAERNPTQLRFLLENFHLILNHRLSKSKKSAEMTTSESGNHLSVLKPSLTDITQADSFYVVPSEDQYTADDYTDDSFQTVENIVINVYEESTSYDTMNDPELTDDVKPDVAKSDTQSKSLQGPITSTPHVSKSSGINHSPNLSYIQKNRSTKASKSSISATNKSYTKTKDPSISARGVTERASRSDLDRRSWAKLSISDINVESNDTIEKVREMHTSIRREISESLISLDKEIANLKRKPPKSDICKPLLAQRPPSNLNWLMPVDSRFPTYGRGVIIPQCTSWRSSRKKTTKPKDTSKSLNVSTASERFPTPAQKGRRLDDHEVIEQELYLYE